MKELQKYWVDQGNDYDYAAYWVFLIFTPVLIILSWLMTMGIDTPAKNLAQDLDMNCRIQKPKPRKGAPPVETLGWGEFFLKKWQVWALTIYLLSVFVVTETYQSFNGNRERMVADG